MKSSGKIAIIILVLVMQISLGYYVLYPLESEEQKKVTKLNNNGNSTTSNDISIYSYKIINTYPHDPDAFTQGLVYENGTLYEGTGRYGRSSLRKVSLLTGEVLKIHNLSSQYFGEGITIFNDKIIQLTWKSKIGFVYDKDSFKLNQTFNYSTEGWGITHDDQNLIMSDGTSTLFYLDPVTFEVIDQIDVKENNTEITNLNELEYIDGNIYANVWKTDRIAIINPRTGNVSGWIDLKGLIEQNDQTQNIDVLNGIAYDSNNGRLFVTGKLWSNVFEIELI